MRLRGRTPQVVEHWAQIPFVPTAAFKELELTSLAPHERTAVFHSSGTTEQIPSRNFHSAESLAVYETSLWKWFEQNVFTDSKLKAQSSKLICLTPPTKSAPHSSLIRMFETVRQMSGLPETAFTGNISTDGSWKVDFTAVIDAFSLKMLRASVEQNHPLILLGTAFSYVHLLDFLVENNLQFQLPEGSRVMETGGYKNRSRTMPKEELHALITEHLGVPRVNIICEYGMSELSSQAYSVRNDECAMMKRNSTGGSLAINHHFHFPPWARVQIISPETGREVAEGETGLIRVFDLANVFSVAAIQAEDLGIRHGDGFELIGRAQLAEPRGCSLN